MQKTFPINAIGILVFVISFLSRINPGLKLPAPLTTPAAFLSYSLLKVDPELYGTQLGRIRAMAKPMLVDPNASIDEDIAIHIVQVALLSLKHPDHVSQSFFL